MGSRLANKVALVTGAGTGIGKACALAFAREGAKVVLVGRRKELLQSVADQMRGGRADSVLVLPADVTKKKNIERVLEQTVAGSAQSTCW